MYEEKVYLEDLMGETVFESYLLGGRLFVQTDTGLVFEFKPVYDDVNDTYVIELVEEED